MAQGAISTLNAIFSVLLASEGRSEKVQRLKSLILAVEPEKERARIRRVHALICYQKIINFLLRRFTRMYPELQPQGWSKP